MRGQFARINDPRQPGYTTMLKINLPPEYLLIHRVWLGGIGVLSQLEAKAPFASILADSLPGFRPSGADALVGLLGGGLPPLGVELRLDAAQVLARAVVAVELRPAVLDRRHPGQRHVSGSSGGVLPHKSQTSISKA